MRPPRTSFLGRDGDLARLRDALAAHPVVTVVGGPGIGKTRLALEAAATPHVVDLTVATGDDAVAATAAAALGLRDVTAFDGLLLLDNCEHVLDGVAALVESLDARVLATSREPLGVPGEYVLPLGPLADADAVRLLAERAALAGAGAEGGDAADLCRRLDGAPLAIELAAAALRTLSVGQLAERLDARLDLLVAGPRTAPERHRSLRAAIAASDALLSAAERDLLRRLAVFAGSFPLDAAERMGGAAELARLVAKSLVVVETGPRYRLPESIRVYAAAETPPDAAAALVAWARAVAEQPPPEDDHAWVDRVAAEHANLDLAATHDPSLVPLLAPAWIANGRLDTAARHLAPLAGTDAAALAAQVALAAGRTDDARRHLDAAGDHPRAALVRAQLANAEADYAAVLVHVARAEQGDADTATAARIARATAYRAQGDYAAAAAAAEDALADAESLGFRRGIAASLLAIGGIRRLQGDFAAATEHFERALATAHDPRTRAIAYGSLGSIAIDSGDPATAVARMTESLAASREYGDQRTTLVTVFNLAEAHRTHGELAAARGRFGEALTIARALDERRSTGWILGALGDIALDEGDLDTAARLLAESLAVREAVLDRRGLAVALDAVGALGVRRGSHYAAARLLAAATALRERIGAPREPALQVTYDGLLARVTDALDEASRDDAIAAGAALDLPAAVAEARRLLAADQQGAPEPPEPRAPAPPRATRHVRTFGGFALLRDGEPVDPRAWQSKKARDLLKILVAHRGSPVHREVLMDLLWPDGEPAALPNRLSVALSTLRSVLDPDRSAPAPVVVADRTAAALNLAVVDVDVETFFGHVAAGRLAEAEAVYAGDFLPEDAYEEWSVGLREQARVAYVTAARALARAAERDGDPERAATLALRILERDPYDEQAHRALVRSLRAAGRHGDAAAAQRTYAHRMAEIGLKTT